MASFGVYLRMRAWFLIACALLAESCARSVPREKGVTWNPESATFAWSGGQVNLPAGFTYQVDKGTDTFEGHLTSADGKLAVRHDIGGYAGAWADRDKSFLFRGTNNTRSGYIPRRRLRQLLLRLPPSHRTLL